MTAFIVGLDEVVVRLDSGIARLISCTSDEELMHSVSGLQRHTPLLVISPGSLPRSVAAHPELIHHFTFLNGALLPRYPPIYDEHKSNVYSGNHLMGELYHKLGQHYQDRAIRASIEFNDQRAAKDLREKSARCYELVECDTETTLKQYAGILKKTFFCPANVSRGTSMSSPLVERSSLFESILINSISAQHSSLNQSFLLVFQISGLDRFTSRSCETINAEQWPMR